MRLHGLNFGDECDKVRKFYEWIADIDDGKIGESNDCHTSIKIPDDLLLKHSGDPIASIVESTYPSFPDVGDGPIYFQEIAILAPTLDIVDVVNEYMNLLNKSDGRKYLSSDSILQSDKYTDYEQQLHTPEFLNKLRASGVPNHELNLKVGTPVMLLRNIDHTVGLCNDTRLKITQHDNHVIHGKILTGSNAGHKMLIPRLTLTPSDVRLPLKFKMRQFSFIVSYEMTINKSQGQSLSKVILLIKKLVFSHEQLYVALSRVTHPEGFKILFFDKDNQPTNITTNLVYHEIFRNV